MNPVRDWFCPEPDFCVFQGAYITKPGEKTGGSVKFVSWPGLVFSSILSADVQAAL
jgi:hypothetical protein